MTIIYCYRRKKRKRPTGTQLGDEGGSRSAIAFALLQHAIEEIEHGIAERLWPKKGGTWQTPRKRFRVTLGKLRASASAITPNIRGLLSPSKSRTGAEMRPALTELNGEK